MSYIHIKSGCYLLQIFIFEMLQQVGLSVRQFLSIEIDVHQPCAAWHKKWRYCLSVKKNIPVYKCQRIFIAVFHALKLKCYRCVWLLVCWIFLQFSMPVRKHSVIHVLSYCVSEWHILASCKSGTVQWQEEELPCCLYIEQQMIHPNMWKNTITLHIPDLNIM